MRLNIEEVSPIGFPRGHIRGIEYKVPGVAVDGPFLFMTAALVQGVGPWVGVNSLLPGDAFASASVRPSSFPTGVVLRGVSFSRAKRFRSVDFPPSSFSNSALIKMMRASGGCPLNPHFWLLACFNESCSISFFLFKRAICMVVHAGGGRLPPNAFLFNSGQLQ